MKKIILLLIGCLFFAVSAQAVIYTSDNTYQVDEILYDKKTNMPITGEVRGIVNLNDNSMTVELPYKDGVLEGLAKTYYENGNLKAELPYKDGVLEGLAKTYYENGNLAGEESYKNGKCEELAKTYYENGSLQAEANCSQGKAVSGYLYDWEGNRTKMTNAHLHNLNKEINSFQ